MGKLNGDKATKIVINLNLRLKILLRLKDMSIAIL